MPLKHIPTGLEVHCVEMSPGRGGTMVRTAGVGARLTNKEGRFATLVMPSGEIRQVLLECRATVGTVGNADNANLDRHRFCSAQIFSFLKIRSGICRMIAMIPHQKNGV
jgi:ribosomal protein L2